MSPIEHIKEDVKHYSVEVLHGPTKPSFVWKYFGGLILKRDDERKHVCSEKVFCRLCLIKKQSDLDTEVDEDNPPTPTPLARSVIFLLVTITGTSRVVIFNS